MGFENICGCVAQLVEREAYTFVAPGSSPGAPTYVLKIYKCATPSVAHLYF